MTESGFQHPADFLDSGGRALNYTVIAQSADEVRHIENAPAISMAKFLVDRRQLELLPTISIYVERGNDPTTLRSECRSANESRTRTSRMQRRSGYVRDLTEIVKRWLAIYDGVRNTASGGIYPPGFAASTWG